MGSANASNSDNAFNVNGNNGNLDNNNVDNANAVRPDSTHYPILICKCYQSV